jgi:hypothetical protein
LQDDVIAMSIYDAFISSNHNDKPIASALQSVMQKLGQAVVSVPGVAHVSATPHVWPKLTSPLMDKIEKLFSNKTSVGTLELPTRAVSIGTT